MFNSDQFINKFYRYINLLLFIMIDHHAKIASELSNIDYLKQPKNNLGVMIYD
ncbi:hypothetical protein FD25_GL002291 [Levilactobacillus acidifarinae DSM 19394]|uniref:Uncharacterized protein n=1 Tax=Levilactobacillus acidifarinae DSM 19394 = JCM 15949 TaxID=1423715 RepID=A0A0R1LIT9_9LACO|nr:hypothetical protein FD25_GL002291 [Levilactobacillus acidifarinae DSM 19394]